MTAERTSPEQAPNGRRWEAVRAAVPSLHPGQQRVAEALLGMSRDEIARVSSAEVARLAGSSAATVVRTCQALGYHGFREFTALLAIDFVPTPVDEGSTPVVSTFERAADALGYLATTIDLGMIDDIADRIWGARRVLVAAYGWSSGAGDVFATDLLARRFAVERPNDHQRRLLAAGSLSAADVCVLVCVSGATPHAQRVARAARQAGATTILVSTFSKSLTADECDMNLVFGTSGWGAEVDHSATTIAQFATLQAIRAAIDARFEPDELERLLAGALASLVESADD